MWVRLIWTTIGRRSPTGQPFLKRSSNAARLADSGERSQTANSTRSNTPAKAPAVRGAGNAPAPPRGAVERLGPLAGVVAEPSAPPGAEDEPARAVVGGHGQHPFRAPVESAPDTA